MKQRRFSRKLLCALVGIVCIVLLGGTVLAVYHQDSPAFLWGQILREHQDAADQEGTPAIIGEHFTVSKDEYDRVLEAQRLIDPDTAEEIAQELLVERYSLFHQAEEAGTVVSEADLDEMIEKNIASFGDMMSTNEDYTAFLEGLGMTNEEYWNSCRDQMRMTESIEVWRNRMYEEYRRENGYDYDPPDNLDTMWNAYYEELVSEIIQQEHIQVVE